MSFKSKQIKDKLATLFYEFLKKEGFEYKKSKNEFVLNKNECSFIFNILQTKWSNHYSIDVRLYIKHRQVEEIYEQVLGKSHGHTLGNTLERIKYSPDGRVVVNGNMGISLFQEEDVDAAADTLKRYYKDIAKPYFEKYETLDVVHEIINNPPFEYCPAHIGGNFDDKCMKGLIIAKLVGSLKFNDLVTIYDQAIKETMNKESIENYYMVKDYLLRIVSI